MQGAFARVVESLDVKPPGLLQALLLKAIDHLHEGLAHGGGKPLRRRTQPCQPLEQLHGRVLKQQRHELPGDTQLIVGQLPVRDCGFPAPMPGSQRLISVPPR